MTTVQHRTEAKPKEIDLEKCLRLVVTSDIRNQAKTPITIEGIVFNIPTYNSPLLRWYWVTDNEIFINAGVITRQEGGRMAAS